MRETFVMYTAYDDKTKTLNDEEMGKLMRAIFEYEKQDDPNYKKQIIESLKEYPTVSVAFMFIADDLDRLNEKYKNKVDAGKKGAEAKKQKQTDIKQSEENYKQSLAEDSNAKQKEANRSRSKANASLYDNDNVNVNDNVLKESIYAPSSSSSTPPVIQIPLNDGSLYDVEEHQAQEWKELFPAVDVMQELRKMKAWCDANPSKRKTKRGVKAFIVKWLMKEQDKGKPVQNHQSERKLPDWYENDDETYEQASEEEIAEFHRMLETFDHV